VKYEEHGKPDEGQKSLKSKKLNVAFGVATIPLDTAKAGLYEYRFQDVSDANYDADSRKKSSTILQQRVRSRPSAKFGTPGHTYSFCTTEGTSDEVVPIKFVGTPPFSIDIDIRHSSSASPESMNVDQIKTNNYDLHLPRRFLRSGHSHLTIRRVRDGRGCQSKVDPTVMPSRVHVSVHDPPNIVPLEAREDYCIGEYFSFRLTGVPPFTVLYTFEGEKRKAIEKTTTFTRFNAMAGQFTITGISDSSSKCQFSTSLKKTIHPNPGVKVDEGREVYADIHEGGESEVVFHMTGTPPFEITYTRSELSKRGQVGRVLETKTIRTNEMVHRKMENQGGSIEPLSIRDKWCLTTKESDGKTKKGQKAQKLLTQ
jgi:nucleoporin POM152